MTVALPALLGHRRVDQPTEVGLEIRGRLIAVHVDDAGVQVTLDPERRPATVVVGEPDAVLGLVAGMLGADHPGLTVQGDPRDVAALFQGAAA